MHNEIVKAVIFCCTLIKYETFHYLIIIIIIIITWQYQRTEMSRKRKKKKKKLNTRAYVQTQRMWNMKCMIIPVIIGATGILTKGLTKQYARFLFFFGFNYCIFYVFCGGRDSSVGIATRYGLDGPGIESRWGARFSVPVHSGPGAHPACYAMGTGSLSRG